MNGIPAGHVPVFYVEIDKTQGSPDSNKLEASLKGGKIVYSRGKNPLKQSFLSKVIQFFSSSKTEAAKNYTKAIMAPVLAKAGVSSNKINDATSQAFDKKKSMQADPFMKIMDQTVAGDYEIAYGAGRAKVIVTVKDGSLS